MLKGLRISPSPLTNRIYAGYVNKAGDSWTSKVDVTGDACASVAQHVLANGTPVIVEANGVPVYRITVEKLEGHLP